MLVYYYFDLFKISRSVIDYSLSQTLNDRKKFFSVNQNVYFTQKENSYYFEQHESVPPRFVELFVEL